MNECLTGLSNSVIHSLDFSSMEALQKEWTAKAKATLPELLVLINDLEKRYASDVLITPEEYTGLLNRYNKHVLILSAFVQTQKRSLKDTDGRHSELVQYCFNALPAVGTPYTTYYKACGVRQEQLSRAGIALLVESLMRAYVVFELNMNDLIQAGAKSI